ncbi:MAG: SH3 domain-containing protein [Chloroflexi bacterium]|nr:SH3 domain-containing protein [Chloroflexota bacterium]
MRHRLWIVFVALGLAACNLPATQVTSTPFPTLLLDTPTSSFSTPTLVPMETLLAIPSPTVTSTSTPGVSLASPIDQPVNCRYGPSTAYSVVGGLELGQQAEVVGRSADSSWWYVRNPSNPSTYCWLFASVTEASGDLEGLPVVSPPVAIVERIDVSVNPISMDVGCGSFPHYVTATATIFTNGPTNLLWRWETSLNEVIEKESLLYLEGGSQTVQEYYRVNSSGDYWIQVHILSPNDTTGRAYFKITCTP